MEEGRAGLTESAVTDNHDEAMKASTLRLIVVSKKSIVLAQSFVCVIIRKVPHKETQASRNSCREMFARSSVDHLREYWRLRSIDRIGFRKACSG